jgi:hypothetical protein
MGRPLTAGPAVRRLEFGYAVAAALPAFISAPAAAQLIDRTAATPVTTVTAEQLEDLPSSRDLRTILDYHNQLRTDANAPPLRWNSDLAAGAAAYGPIISRGGTLRHSSREGRKTIRENLLQSPRGLYSPLQMVQVWGNEKNLFRPGTFPDVSADGNWASVGHYTQMVWPTTQEVGCAIHSDARYDWLICGYSPPGEPGRRGDRLPADRGCSSAGDEHQQPAGSGGSATAAERTPGADPDILRSSRATGRKRELQNNASRSVLRPHVDHRRYVRRRRQEDRRAVATFLAQRIRNKPHSKGSLGTYILDVERPIRG